MARIESLMRRLDQRADVQDWEGGYEAGLALWQYPGYEAEIVDERVRIRYVSALFKVADLFQYVGHSTYDTLAPLKRAYALDDGHLLEGADHSAKELAAHKLGNLYEEARCPHSALEWFRRALLLAQSAGVASNILRNLHRLAWNLETLAAYEEAGSYYGRMLEMLSGLPVQEHPYWLVPAAMYQIHHGDAARGEALMRSLIAATLGGSELRRAAPEPLQVWFLSALRALGMHRIARGQPQEAIELARLVGRSAARFEEPTWAQEVEHGLAARALVHMGRLDEALAELDHVFDVEETTFFSYEGPLETLELEGDIARVHVAHGRYEQAMHAYEMLAYHLGAYIANPRLAQTARLRFSWLQQQAAIVHEMASVWLTIRDGQARQAVEATVAKALLQLKANLFIAMEAHKLDVLKYATGQSLFEANRQYAAAARRMLAAPGDPAAVLALEDALFHREEIEGRLLSGDMMPLPGLAGILRFDFRTSQALGDDRLLLDYSLIRYRPPRDGLAGTPQGLRYVGVRLAKGELRMIDLGEAGPIDALCQPYIQALSRLPSASAPSIPEQRDARPRRPVTRPAETEADLEQRAAEVYRRLVAPFEPLAGSLLFSPDGLLAAIPFHALVHGDRYLIEDREVVLCHSLLQKESLSRRQLSPGRRSVPSTTRSALLLGNPDYLASGLPSLPGTELELRQVAELLKTVTFPEGARVFEQVYVHSGEQATVARLLDVSWPRVLHIAAHGTFDPSQTRLFADAADTPGSRYRRWEEMGAAPLTALDNALLHSILILSPESEPAEDPAEGAVLTALELASLNLIGCHVVVLSACETGAGATEYGAGVLGFQYAILASFARAGLLSLWKVPDRETASFMVDFYRSFLDRQGVKEGYLETVRAHCRRDGRRIDPYEWAAFVLVDQEYYHPVF